jgi:hypothetical protein
MNPSYEIQSFLNDFKTKLSVWGVVFRDDRPKNSQTLLLLDISTNRRLEILKSLQVKDYSEGPLHENLYGGADMWVFGKDVRGQEVYIKITMGIPGNKAICISFHIAEHPIGYPLKKEL